MPQPKPGNAGHDTDILVRGMVGVDGKIHDPVVQASDRADLNAEALQIVGQWEFTPAMCNGLANTMQVDIVLHFRGR
jgi:TonB family protein